ncbi:hypothetical protein BJV78DRAFT_689308 [Lactifluus subvellereus]|nr:hypothetical protein BJV78DRAFT_689308 [Lactifluus subvellereus]
MQDHKRKGKSTGNAGECFVESRREEEAKQSKPKRVSRTFIYLPGMITWSNADGFISVKTGTWFHAPPSPLPPRATDDLSRTLAINYATETGNAQDYAGRVSHRKAHFRCVFDGAMGEEEARDCIGRMEKEERLYEEC